MTTDPAPHLTDPDDAFERLDDWRRHYDLLMSQRDPLVRAALCGPLSGHGGITQAGRASDLTAQTLRRIKDRTDIPLLADVHFDDVDWDEYADYLEALGTITRNRLAQLPAPTTGRPFTADDLRAALLIRLAQRLRETEPTDAAFWQLTMQLRHEALAGTRVVNDGWTESVHEASSRAEEARVLNEVADQISAFRTDGPAASALLDTEVFDRVRAELAPSPSAHLARQPILTEEPR
ncbi:hypothetical protein [Kitasatospora sp. NPDC057738]|uniref:hypothetical protein n=1 Tax=Kitasatospora sp. NPDC057738 TaxID=3346233 RepID=UPI00369954F7